MGWELFQHAEETRCGTFEPKFAAERKVSFERDGLDASKVCHISVRGDAQPCCRGLEAPGRSGKTAECYQLRFECLQIK